MLQIQLVNGMSAFWFPGSTCNGVFRVVCRARKCREPHGLSVYQDSRAGAQLAFLRSVPAGTALSRFAGNDQSRSVHGTIDTARLRNECY